MAEPANRLHYSYADYLAFERVSNTKHEYLEGTIYAMAGGSAAHAALALAIGGELRSQLRGGPCIVYSSDLRVRVVATGLAAYPDGTVVCGELERDPEDRHTIVNPTLIIEVLSDGTEAYDRGEKLTHYKSIPSLRQVVLASQHEPLMESWSRMDGAWSKMSARSGERVELDSIGCVLDVDAVYSGIPLEG